MAKIYTPADRREIVRTINAFDTSYGFHVRTQLFFYQPTSKEVLEETGMEGTNLVSQNYVMVFKDGDWIDVRSKEAVRQIWLECVTDPERRDHHDRVTAAFIAAAKHPIPSEFTVHLPVPKKFRDDPVYGEIFQRQSNGASYEEVVKTMIPFAQTRGMVISIQNELNVPLHHVNIMSFRQNDAPMLRSRMN